MAIGKTFDSDDIAIVLASLYTALGIRVKFVVVGNGESFHHVYCVPLQSSLDEAILRAHGIETEKETWSPAPLFQIED